MCSLCSEPPESPASYRGVAPRNWGGWEGLPPILPVATRPPSREMLAYVDDTDAGNLLHAITLASDLSAPIPKWAGQPYIKHSMLWSDTVGLAHSTDKVILAYAAVRSGARLRPQNVEEMTQHVRGTNMHERLAMSALITRQHLYWAWREREEARRDVMCG